MNINVSSFRDSSVAFLAEKLWSHFKTNASSKLMNPNRRTGLSPCPVHPKVESFRDSEQSNLSNHRRLIIARIFASIENRISFSSPQTSFALTRAGLNPVERSLYNSSITPIGSQESTWWSEVLYGDRRVSGEWGDGSTFQGSRSGSKFT